MYKYAATSNQNGALMWCLSQKIPRPLHIRPCINPSRDLQGGLLQVSSTPSFIKMKVQIYQLFVQRIAWRKEKSHEKKNVLQNRFRCFREIATIRHYAWTGTQFSKVQLSYDDCLCHHLQTYVMFGVIRF